MEFYNFQSLNLKYLKYWRNRDFFFVQLARTSKGIGHAHTFLYVLFRDKIRMSIQSITSFTVINVKILYLAKISHYSVATHCKINL
jgi:hypothetical protein